MNVTLQIKRFVADYGPAIALGLAILGVVCLLGAGLTYATPPETSVTVQTNEQQVSTSVGTSAVVTENTSLYEQGTRLQDMPVYFFGVSPNMTFHVRTAVPEGESVTVSQRLVLRMSASRGGEQYWSDQHLILAGKSTVTDGVAWANGTVRVMDLRSLVSKHRNEIGEVGQFNANLHLNVTYETARYAGRLQSATSLVTTGRAYWLASDLGASESHSTAETRRIVGEPDMTRVSGLAGLGLVALFAANWVRRRYRRLDPRELELELTRARYDEWISNGEIPTKSEKEYIHVDSLADLVDVAIDSNKRVIHDTEFDVYGVVAGDIVYHFSIGDEDVTEWFDV